TTTARCSSSASRTNPSPPTSPSCRSSTKSPRNCVQTATAANHLFVGARLVYPEPRRAAPFFAPTLKARLILLPKPMLQLTLFAKRRPIHVIHIMLHWLQRLQISKHRIQVFVRHPAHRFPRHHWIQLTQPSHGSGSDRLHKHFRCVVADSCLVRSDVRAGHL